MERIDTGIPGLIVLKPKLFGDKRGYFMESFAQNVFDGLAGRHVTFVQDNESSSCRGVVRGLHFQRGTSAQAKLVRVVHGLVRDVAVDLRRGSPTFGKHYSVDLSDDNKLQFFIPRGFAHGFAVLSDYAVFQYKCDNYYDPASEGGLAWDDPELGIDWGMSPSEAILSDKDLNRMKLSELADEMLFDYDE